MLTGHLSKYLSGPPGPKLQQFNALLHTEPYSFIVYGIYWFFVLSIGGPLVAVSVVYLMLYEVFRHFVWKRRKIEPRGQTDRLLAVVVTGCDTGFGKEIVFRLVAEGFVVFAGCLKKESKKQYEGLPMVIPMVLDVTSDKQVAQAFISMENWLNDPSAKKKRYLHALVNNAGIGRAGYVDWANISDYQICMDVNCFSLVRMVKAFLPIFKRQAAEQTYGDARIMNVVSMAGMLSAGGMAMTPYEVSKNAAEAFTDGLRLEMKMFGVDVIAVNPSFHKTPLATGIRRRLEKDIWDQLNPKIKKEYGQDFFDNYADHVETMVSVSQWDFKVVVDSIVQAIQSSQPPAQLLIGADAKYSMVVLRMFPQWLRHYLIQATMPNKSPAMMKKTSTKGEN